MKEFPVGTAFKLKKLLAELSKKVCVEHLRIEKEVFDSRTLKNVSCFQLKMTVKVFLHIRWFNTYGQSN